MTIGSIFCHSIKLIQRIFLSEEKQIINLLVSNLKYNIIKSPCKNAKYNTHSNTSNSIKRSKYDEFCVLANPVINQWRIFVWLYCWKCKSSFFQAQIWQIFSSISAFLAFITTTLQAHYGLNFQNPPKNNNKNVLSLLIKETLIDISFLFHVWSKQSCSTSTFYLTGI